MKDHDGFFFVPVNLWTQNIKPRVSQSESELSNEAVVGNQNNWSRASQISAGWRRLPLDEEKLWDEWRKVAYCCGHSNGSKTAKGGQIISRGRFLGASLMLDYPDGEAIDLRMLPP